MNKVKSLKIPKYFIEHFKEKYDLNDVYIKRLYLLKPHFTSIKKEMIYYGTYKYKDDNLNAIFRAIINKYFNMVFFDRIYYKEPDINGVEIKNLNEWVEKWHEKKSYL